MPTLAYPLHRPTPRPSSLRSSSIHRPTFSPRRRPAAVTVLAFLVSPVTAQIDLDYLGSYDSGAGEAAAEIAAFDPATNRLFVLNAVAGGDDGSGTTCIRGATPFCLLDLRFRIRFGSPTTPGVLY
ncbi:MAG TPA: hypothetical protein VGG06_34725 [Thermoanaerobaculia bacterium]